MVEALDRALPLLTSPSLRARAYTQLGVANVMLKTPESLNRAVEVLRQGAELGGPWGAMARYNLAEALFRKQSWAEAVEAARGYLKEAGPEGTALKEARILLCSARGHLPEEPAAEPGQDSELKTMEDGITRPEIIFRTNPVYPHDARVAQTKGEVMVQAIIDQDGCVGNVKSLKGLPNGLTESAMDAVPY